ncbi:MAG: EVE domain-containing protein [Planctomycetes bacterium]|nr:EVE domain-containing protein [Planctomycetota bacterium]
MARAHWLVKTEPTVYGWADMLRDGVTHWDGVRNFQARNNLAAMKVGDRALWYHSVGDREVVGVVEVVREAYPDPTADDPRWVVVDVKPVAALARPVTLAEIKADPRLKEIALVRQSRLSVCPLDADAYRAIVDMGGGEKRLKRRS